MQVPTRVILGVVLLCSVFVPAGMAQESEVDGHSPALCGPGDLKETGIQGDIPRADQESGRADQGYKCGLTVVAHHDLAGLGGGAMAWAGHCAFVASASKIQVFDMSDPTTPKITTTLDVPSPGFEIVTPEGGPGHGVTPSGSENMDAVVTDERAVLVFGRFVYEVSDCEQPVFKGEIPYEDGASDGVVVLGQPHNIKISPDGTKVIGTMPLTEASLPDLDDAATWSVRNFQCDIAKQVQPISACQVVPSDRAHALVFPTPQLAHEPEYNLDGTRLYIAGQKQQDFGQDLPLFPRQEYLRVLDMTVWPPKVLGESFGPGHGMNFATIGGREYLLHSNEAGKPGGACQPPPHLSISDSNAEVYLTNISVEEEPTRVPNSTMRMAINNPDPDTCAAQVDSNDGPTCSSSGGGGSVLLNLLAAPSAAATGSAASCIATPHYHNVDDPNDTTFAMLSMTSAGLRIWDVRDPSYPREVAYFNPAQIRNADGTATPDGAGAYAHYDAATGYVWLTTRAGGFWVLDLQPQVREYLGLDEGQVPLPAG